MDDDDIYGEDLYAEYDQQGYRGDEAGPAGHTGEAYRAAEGRGTAQLAPAELTERLRQRDAQVNELQAQLQNAKAALEEWQSSFRNAASGSVDPAAIMAELRKAREADATFQAQLDQAQQKEAALQMQLAERTMENIDLRRQLHQARQAADPTIAQVRQLLLDPAVAREFQRLREEVEGKAKEVKQLQEELQAVNFSQESKAGRMLMAKCRALQDENEEMGRELSEGKVHALERQVALAKGYVEDMRKNYVELEDHCHIMDEEAEELQQQVFALKRQIREFESQSGVQLGYPQKYGTDRRGPPTSKPFINMGAFAPPTMRMPLRQAGGPSDRERMPPPGEAGGEERFRKRMR
ncbi:hypothetical protein WJX72_011713 [[Myrmecia] bisecta]|uniref:Uncharacterized protein n=1 Tax=[Myrmecia] bisecta TaxID=41462 RepID=A0AAW1PU35_9CHLO